MLKMRLQRVGRKHEPIFRLVLTDSKNSTKSGRFKEILGSFDPRKSVDAFKVDRVKHWLSKGTAITDTVHNLFITHKIIDAKKINVLPRKTPIAKEIKIEELKIEAKPEVKEEVKAGEVVAEVPVVEETAPEAPVAETPVESAPVVE